MTFPVSTLKYLDRNNSGLSYLREGCNYVAIYFAWMNGDTQIKQLETCRGYMMESAFASINTTDDYGVGGWEPKFGRVNFDRMELLVGSSKDKLDPLMPNIADFLHQIEDMLGFDHSEFAKAENVKKSDVWMLKGDKRWMLAPFMLSTYMFFIRTVAAFTHKVGDKAENSLKKFYSDCDARINANYDDDEYDRYDDDQIEYEDAEDFYYSYPFIMKVLKYGCEPFFYADFRKNFPDVEDVHDWGMCSTATNRVHGNGGSRSNEAIECCNYAHRFKTDEEIEAWIAENNAGKKAVNKAKAVQAAKAPKGKVGIKVLTTKTKIGELVGKTAR